MNLQNLPSDEAWWKKATNPQTQHALLLMVLKNLRDLEINQHTTFHEAIGMLSALKTYVNLIDLEQYQKKVSPIMDADEHLLNKLTENPDYL